MNVYIISYQVHFQTGEQVIPSQVTFADERKLKTIPNSKVTSDKTLLSENSLLKDQVERERFRRKVIVYNKTIDRV